MAFDLHPMGGMRAAFGKRRIGRSRLVTASIALIAAVGTIGWASPAAAPSAETEALARELAGVIRVPGWSNDSWGVLVVSLDHGDTLFAHQPRQALIPASNLKLFTSAAALYYLGPDYRYGTYLASAGTVENGVLRGDLHVYGTGDPTLSERFGGSDLDVWRAFADTLAASGVREVQGDVVGDGSYFQGRATGAGWHTSYINAWYAAPAGALSFNENMVTLRVRPAEQTGWRPRVDLVPGAAGVAIVNLATTVDGAGSRLEVTRAAYDGPIVIRGEIGRGAGATWHGVPVPDPARFAAAALREVLEAEGIRVTGAVRAIHDPEQSLFTERMVFAPGFAGSESPRVIAMHWSPPLVEILKVVNKRSHNFYAEQVLRTVGRATSGAGSTEGGQRAVVAMIERETGSAPAVLAMDDGSGLSVDDRVTPESIIQLLTAMSGSPMFPSYLETLPESGERGLRRMGGTPAQGNLRAKTGTINNVSALSGYVTAANGERLAFAIISNGVPSTWRAKRVEDQIGARLAAFSRPRPSPQVASTESAPAPPPGRTTADTTPAADAAPAPEAPAPRPETTPAAAATTHVIRSGDTLDGIARQYGTTVNAVRQANPGINPRRLIPGREIRLP